MKIISIIHLSIKFLWRFKNTNNCYYSNLDSSKIKSKSFTTTVDQYSQVAVTVSGTIIAAIAPRYLVIVQDDNHTLRLFGNIAQYQLNRVDQGTTVNVTVFYF